MVSNDHKGSDWVDAWGDPVYTVSTGDKYDDAGWKDMKSSMPMFGTRGAYCSGSTPMSIYMYDFANGTNRLINDDYTAKWYVWDNSGKTKLTWSDNYCHLDSYKNYIVITLSDTIIVIDQNGEEAASYDSLAGRGSIYGGRMNGDKLIYDVYMNPTLTQGYDTTKVGRYEQEIKPSVPVTAITLNRSSLTLEIGGTETLTATVAPSNATKKTVAWSSDNEGIASVDSNGKITAKAKGTAVITASATDKSKKSASCRVTVIPVQIKSITLNKSRLRMEKGNTEVLTAVIMPENAEDKKVTWKSGNKAVATVDSNGTVTAVDNGTTVITAKAGSLTAECAVVVKDMLQCTSPRASRASGEVIKGTKILLNCETPGASIYYTMDGITPDPATAAGSVASGTMLYNDAIEISQDTVIRAVSVCDGFRTSDITEFRYNVIKEWGDIDESLRTLLGDDVNNIPDGLWYVPGDGRIYTASSGTLVSRTYNGEKITFNNDISVFYRNTRLSENRDYKLTYANNVKAAAASDRKAPSVSVVGLNNYCNKAVFKYSIVPDDINNAVLNTAERIYVKSGSRLKTVSPVVIYHGRKLKQGTDYDCVYYKGSKSDGNKVDGNVEVTPGDGQYEIEITAHNNGCFTGTLAETVIVEAYAIKGKTEMKKVKVSVPSFKWTGEPVDVQAIFDNSGGKKASATVKKGVNALLYGEDFTVEEVRGDDYLSPGSHTVILRGTGAENASGYSYVGERSVSFKIDGVDASGVKISGLNTTPEYTGNVITLSDLSTGGSASGEEGIVLYTVNKGVKTILTEDDYDLDMSQAGASGIFTISFVLKNGYAGTIDRKIKVKPYNMSKDAGAKINVECSECAYSKAGSVPDVKVTFGERTLREGIDYSLSFSNNKTVKKQPMVTVKGKGYFTGSTKVPFTIVKAPVSRLTLFAPDRDYKQTAGKGYFKVLPKVTDNGAALTGGKDIDKITVNSCKYFYADSGDEIPDADIVAPGTIIEVRADISCPSNSPYTGTAELKTRYRMIKKENNIKKAVVKASGSASFCFDDGNDVIPNKSNLTVTLNKKILTNNEYDIVSIHNNRFVGTATVEIAGRGDYGGRKKFTIKLNRRKLG